MDLTVGQIVAVIIALWMALVSLAGVVYKEVKDQLKVCQERNKALETEALAAVRAKDEEIREWRRLGLERQPPRGRSS